LLFDHKNWLLRGQFALSGLAMQSKIDDFGVTSAISRSPLPKKCHILTQMRARSHRRVEKDSRRSTKSPFAQLHLSWRPGDLPSTTPPNHKPHNLIISRIAPRRFPGKVIDVGHAIVGIILPAR
jgi:hypothetical protein